MLHRRQDKCTRTLSTEAHAKRYTPIHPPCLPNQWLRCSPWLYCSKSTIVYIFIFGCSIPVRSDCHDVLTSISCVYRLLWPNHVTSDMSMLAWNVSEWFYDILESSQCVSFLLFRYLIMIYNLSVKWIDFTRICHENWIFNKEFDTKYKLE